MIDSDVRFMARDTQWSDDMKDLVRGKIVAPLARHSDGARLLSAHLENDAGLLTLWMVLQTFDGRKNEVVRRQGADFATLVNDVSSSMRSRLRQARGARRGLFYLMRNLAGPAAPASRAL